MTKGEREDTIAQVRMAFAVWEDEFDVGDDWSKQHKARDRAIEVLKKEPCEDAINRKDMYFKLTNGAYPNETIEQFIDRLVKELEDMPPVEPTRKKGKWINRSHKSDCGITFIASECSCCNKKTFFDCDLLVYKFCPNCGAEMESEE